MNRTNIEKSVNNKLLMMVTGEIWICKGQRHSEKRDH